MVVGLASRDIRSFVAHRTDDKRGSVDRVV
jgi:hypothetical protein